METKRLRYPKFTAGEIMEAGFRSSMLLYIGAFQDPKK